MKAAILLTEKMGFFSFMADLLGFITRLLLPNICVRKEVKHNLSYSV
jgi:hypothetical protein